MHKLSLFSLKNRALIALVTVVVAVFGGLAFTSLKQELIPSIEVPQLAVLTAHPGASVEVVASDVTAPVEKALQTVPGLLGTTSTSSTGMSVVLAEFEFGRRHHRRDHRDAAVRRRDDKAFANRRHTGRIAEKQCAPHR